MITATPDPNPAASVRHIRLTVALLLAALLALLWWTGHGPFATAGCCGNPAASPAPTAEAVPPPAPAAAPPAAMPPASEAPAAPAYEIRDPNGQVTANPSTLEKWTGPSEPVFEHEVQVPAPRPAPPVEALAEADPIEEVAPVPVEEVAEVPPEPTPAPAPVEPEVEAPPAPSYVVTDPNAQVRPNSVELAPWTGATPPTFEHDVYYPPARAVVEQPVAEPADTAPGGVPPAATVYFATSKWDLPADTDAKLAPIIAYLAAHPSAKAVIQGYHDPRGDADTNAFLAKNRAGALWNVLTAAGISKDRVILQKPENTTGTGSLAEARRAEVSVQAE
jgi:outer membrane protein OmpA-like peptidoglycan-associated protein